MRYIVCITNDCSSAIKTNNDEVIFISDKKDAQKALDLYMEGYDAVYEFIEFDEKSEVIRYNIDWFGNEEEPQYTESCLYLFPLKSAKEL